jgi:hypothetical protein
MASQRTGPFMIMSYHASLLSLIIFLVLKSALYEIDLITKAFFLLELIWCVFLHLFIVNQRLCVKMGFLRREIVGSCFVIHSGSLFV